MVQDSSGRVLNKWSMANHEDEQLILQQFLRFGETKTIAQELIARDTWDQASRSTTSSAPTSGATPAGHAGGAPGLATRTESDIKKFIERSNSIGMQSFIKGYDAAQQLLSRTFMYPHLASAGFARLLTPTLFHGLAPAAAAAAAAAAGSASRDAGQVVLQAAPTLVNPLVRSPLRSLQTMEPFDYRKDSSNACNPKIGCGLPTPSGSSINNQAATAAALAAAAKWDNRTLLNLAIGSGGLTLSNHLPISIKNEALDKSIKTLTTNDLKHPRDAASATDCAINYSIKDRQRVSTSSLNQNHTTSQITSSPMCVQPNALPNISQSIVSAALASSQTGINSSIYVNQKLKHLRKFSNPMKRPWQPTPGYGGTLISPSGKKRVLCTACHKTFCDKGALKIHYSAVHLKEMHRCTVDGCTMMFSSRRSRNRHSANPNPKLHMPQTVRRKLPDNMASAGSIMNVDDGMADMRMYSSHPDDDDGSALSPHVVLDDMSNSSAGTLSSERDSVKGATTPANLVAAEELSMSGSGKENPAFQVGSDARYFLNIALPEVVNLSGHRSSSEDLTKREQQGVDEMNGGSSSEMLQEMSTARSSKRKSTMPTRCSLQTDDVISDENSVANEEQGDEKEAEPEAKRVCYKLDKTNEEEMVTSSHKDDVTLEEDNNNSKKRQQAENETALALTCYTEKKRDGETRAPCGDPEMNSRTSTPKSKLGGSVASKPLTLQIVSGCDLPSPITDDNRSKDLPQLKVVIPCCPTSSEQLNNGGALSDRSLDNNWINDSGVADMKCLEECDLDRKCDTCNKTFLTHFSGTKSSTHVCVVEGCHATFPSKRSRDRHSANLNLHRRLLTASSNEGGVSTRNDAAPADVRDVTDAEFLSEKQASNLQTTADDEYEVLNLTKSAIEQQQQQLQQQQRGMTSPDCRVKDEEKELKSQQQQQFNEAENDSEDESGSVNEIENEIGASISCHLCNRHPFKDNLALKEHMEKVHPKEMYHCTIDGCDKIFSTRKSRNRHSQNDNLHKHLSSSPSSPSSAAVTSSAAAVAAIIPPSSVVRQLAL